MVVQPYKTERLAVPSCLPHGGGDGIEARSCVLH